MAFIGQSQSENSIGCEMSGGSFQGDSQSSTGSLPSWRPQPKTNRLETPRHSIAGLMSCPKRLTAFRRCLMTSPERTFTTITTDATGLIRPTPTRSHPTFRDKWPELPVYSEPPGSKFLGWFRLE